MQKLVIDLSTGIESLVEMTEDEIQNLENIKAESIAIEQAKEAEAAAKAEAKASAEAKLSALGLTSEEIAAL